MMDTLTNPSTYAAHFPMIRAGGLFIFMMGVAVLCGALWPTRRRLFLILGGVAATLAIALTAGRLSAPYGEPAVRQLYFLFGSIALEGALIRVAVARYRAAGERALLLAILFAVGLHFLPMAGAFGPLCFLLGLTLCFCSGAGLWLASAIPLNVFWAGDAIVKLCFGSVMFFLF